MSKQPFLPLFVGDFLAATAEWEGEERGLYVLLLLHQWSIGSLPSDLRKLCRLAQYSEQNFHEYWKVVGQKFVDDGEGRLINRRLEEHRAKSIEIAKKNSDNGRKGASARYKKDSERQATANDEPSDREATANGVAIASIPSHPIPSQSYPSNPEREPEHSQDDDGRTEGETRGSQTGGKIGLVASRRLPADHSIEHLREWATTHTPTIDFDHAVAKLREHEFPTPREDWDSEARKWLLNERPRSTSNSTATNDAAELHRLKERRSQLTPPLTDFRDPFPGESAKDYREAQNHEHEQLQARHYRELRERAVGAVKAVA